MGKKQKLPAFWTDKVDMEPFFKLKVTIPPDSASMFKFLKDAVIHGQAWILCSKFYFMQFHLHPLLHAIIH